VTKGNRERKARDIKKTISQLAGWQASVG